MSKEVTNNVLAELINRRFDENKKDTEDLAVMIQNQFSEQDKRFDKRFDQQDERLESLELKMTNVAYRFEIVELQ